MLGRITRQYRRLVFGMVLFAIYMGLGFLMGKAQIPPDLSTPILLIALVIVLVLVIGVPLLVLAVALPSALPMVELFLLTLITSALLNPCWEWLRDAAALPGWTNGFAVMALFVVIERSLYGPWFSKLGRRDISQTGRITVRATPQELWQALLPDPAHSKNYPWPGITYLPAPEGSGADMVLSRPRREPFKDRLSLIAIEAAEPYSVFRYRDVPVAHNDVTMDVTTRLFPRDDATTDLEIEETLHDVPFGKRLFLYLTNDFNDRLASRRARVEGRRDWSISGNQMPRG